MFYQDPRTWARGHSFPNPVEASRPRSSNIAFNAFEVNRNLLENMVEVRLSSPGDPISYNLGFKRLQTHAPTPLAHRRAWRVRQYPHADAGSRGIRRRRLPPPINSLPREACASARLT